MRRRRLFALLALAALVVAVGLALALSSGSGGPRYVPSGASVITPQPATPRLPRAHRATRPAPAAVALAARLPLARQVSQLFLVTIDGRSAAAIGGLAGMDWGGVVFSSASFASDGQVAALARQLAAGGRTAGHLPPILAATQEGGPDTAFADLPPRSEPAIAASGQPAVAQRQALAAGRRLRLLGFDMTLAPLADVDTPGGPLSGRLFSTDPGTVARFTAAAVRGYAQAGVISAVGHFPGEGAASADPDQMPASVGGSIAQLESHDLVPFAAISSSAPVIVMSNASYAAFDGVTPAGLLSSAVKLLRDQYGFGGVVMSDDLDATLQPTSQSPGAAALQALDAGDDLLYISGPPSEHLQAYGGILAAAQRSARVRARVRDALVADLSLKVRYGLVK